MRKKLWHFKFIAYLKLQLLQSESMQWVVYVTYTTAGNVDDDFCTK